MPPSTLRPATTSHRRPSPSVSVVIPVRDPGGLPLMLRGLPPVAEVIVVAEGPAAEAAAVVRSARPDARVLRPGRPGPGNALATGLAAAQGDVVVTLNGDGSTDPGEIPHYVAALLDGADVALGSRYREGGRDLTGGRFRRWANLLLVWILNTLFHIRRTDPGFGYAAFWRDALDALEVPDPSARSAATWGDGPELGPLLALRPSLRGMQVTEIGSVAYPRMRRPARADTPTVSHWLRVITTEYRSRRGRHSTPDRTTLLATAAPTPSSFAPRAGSTRPDDSGPRSSAALQGRPAAHDGTDHAAPTHGDATHGDATHGHATHEDATHGDATLGGVAHRDAAPSRTSLGGITPEGTAHGDAAGGDSSYGGDTAIHGSGDTVMGAGVTDSAADGSGSPLPVRRALGEPLWGPPRRRSSPGSDLWRTGEYPAGEYPARGNPGGEYPVGHTSSSSITNVTPNAWLVGYPARALLPGPEPERRANRDRPSGSLDPMPRSAGGGDSMPRSAGGDPMPRTGGPGAMARSVEEVRPGSAVARYVPPQPPVRREVGTKRRRLEVRQRPDLRVINGEGTGTGTGRTRSGRLRPVPRENPGT